MWKQKPYKLSNNYQNLETAFPLSSFKTTIAVRRDLLRMSLKVKS